MGRKKYNGLELDERTGACLVGHGFSRDTKTLQRRPVPLGGEILFVPASQNEIGSDNLFAAVICLEARFLLARISHDPNEVANR